MNRPGFPSPTLHVAFAGQRVAVKSHVRQLLAALSAHFRHFHGCNASTPVGTIEVHATGTGYEVCINGVTTLTDTSLTAIACHVKYEVTVRLIEAVPALLWLHASAVSCNDRSMVYLGPRGAVNSRLARLLVERGSTYRCDDIVPLDLTLHTVLPFPETPMQRSKVNHELCPCHVDQLDKTEVALPEDAVCRAAWVVTIMVLPTYILSSKTILTPCSPDATTTAIDILQHSIHWRASDHSMISKLLGSIRSIPIYRLTYGDPETAVTLLSKVLLN